MAVVIVVKGVIVVTGLTVVAGEPILVALGITLQAEFVLKD